MDRHNAEELHAWADALQSQASDSANKDDPRWLKRRADRLRALGKENRKRSSIKWRHGPFESLPKMNLYGCVQRAAPVEKWAFGIVSVPARSDQMFRSLMDAPQVLEAEIATLLRRRREKLLRAEQRRRILTAITFGLSGCIVILALAAFFVAHDREAARIGAAMACVALSMTTFAHFAAQYAGKRAMHSAQEIDSST